MRPSSDGVCCCCHGRSFRILELQPIVRAPGSPVVHSKPNGKWLRIANDLADNHKPTDQPGVTTKDNLRWGSRWAAMFVSVVSESKHTWSLRIKSQCHRETLQHKRKPKQQQQHRRQQPRRQQRSSRSTGRTHDQYRRHGNRVKSRHSDFGVAAPPVRWLTTSWAGFRLWLRSGNRIFQRAFDRNPSVNFHLYFRCLRLRVPPAVTVPELVLVDGLPELGRHVVRDVDRAVGVAVAGPSGRRQVPGVACTWRGSRPAEHR